MESFTFSYPTKVYFGEGALSRALPGELEHVGKTVMLAYGGGSIKRNGLYDEVMGMLSAAGKEVVEFGGIMPNPTYAKVQEGAKLAREKNVDFILSVGGGSVMDCMKIVSVQAKSDEDVWHLEMDEGKFPTEGIPMGGVVTIFGTGAEMNNGGVITNEELKRKDGMLGSFYGFAVLDPAYTLSAPLRQALSGAFDMLSHSMETYFGTPRGTAADAIYSDRINEATQRSIIDNTRAMVADPTDVVCRGELFWASAMAENGMLKAGKAHTDFQAHWIEHQLGAYTDCNHGLGLAVIHPRMYRHIYKEAPEQFARWAVEVWGVDASGKTVEQVALAGIEALEAYIAEVGLPRTFQEMGIEDDSCFRAVADSTKPSHGCAKALDADEIYQILEECMG